MLKVTKQCPHTNTVQSGNPGIIETFCADCNELIKVVKFGSSQTGSVGMAYIGITKLKHYENM